MNKFNIVYSFFFIFTSLILVNNSIKSKELKAKQTIDMKSIECNKEEYRLWKNYSKFDF